MTRIPLKLTLTTLLLLWGGTLAARSQSISKTADGFDLPVAPPNGDGYYKSRGFRSGGHMGEDWLVTDGSSKHSLGRPVHSIGNGLVVLARDIHAAWGNVVIVRHSWIENKQLKFADSLYAHLDKITVREGQQINKGRQVGTIGNNHGIYPAHLHFEIHKDLSIGVNHSQGTKDLRSYWLPTEFIMARRHLSGGGRNVPTPAANFLLPSTEHPWFFHRSSSKSKSASQSKSKSSESKSSSSSSHSSSSSSSHSSSGTYKVNRYSDP